MRNVGIFTVGLSGIIGKTFYGLAMLYSYRAWIKEICCADHSEIGVVAFGGKSNPRRSGWKGGTPGCFGREYQDGARE